MLPSVATLGASSAGRPPPPSWCANARLIALSMLALVATPRTSRAEDASAPVASAVQPTQTTRAPRTAHPFRALVENGLALGIGATWYWADRNANSADWDHPSFRARFTSAAVRFDNNGFPINFLWHPLSGAAYYGLPRVNGLSMPISFLYAAVTSTTWEYLVEFNEKVSINDLLVTPTAGMALGEFFYRIGEYLTSAPRGGTRVQRALAWTLGFPVRLHDAMDRRPYAPSSVSTDRLGYDAAIAHRFRASVGASLGRTASGLVPLVELSVSADLIAIPHYLRTQARPRFFADANRSSFAFRLLAGDGSGVEMRADTVAFGLLVQRAEGDTHAAALTLGVAIGYLYRWDDVPGYRDRLGITHLPGLGFDVEGKAPHARYRLSLRGHGDFAGVNSMLFEDWRAQHADTERAKSSLEGHGYYYGFGLSTSATFAIDFGPIGIEGHVLYGRYASKEGLDRHQEDVTDDFHLTDRVLDTAIAIRATPAPRSPVELELAFATTKRWETLDRAFATRAYQRATLRLVSRF